MSADGPALVSGAVLQGDAPTSDLAERGECLAKAQLYGTMDPWAWAPMLSTTEIVAFSRSVPSGQTLGTVCEFTVQSFGAQNLRLRTANWFGDPNIPPGSWDTTLEDYPPPPPDPPRHPRGAYDHSGLILGCGSFNINDYPSGVFSEVGSCLRDGTEEAHFPGDPFGFGPSTTNWGLYGANLKYRWQITNSGPPGNVYAYINAVNNNGRYFGAARISLWDVRAAKGVPEIWFVDPAVTNEPNLVNLTEDGPLAVASGANLILEIELANGGSAALPSALILSKTQLEAHPVN